MAMLQVNKSNVDLKGILFDKDGTLVDFIYTWGYWSQLMLEHFSKELVSRKLQPLDDEIYPALGLIGSKQLGVTDYDRQGPLSVGSLNDLLAIMSLYGYKSGLTWAEARLLAVESQKFASSSIDTERRIQQLPGISSFLKQCCQHQLKLAVVTADHTKPAQQQLAWLELEHVFDTIIGHDSVDNGKPHPDMVYLACKRLGLSPAEVVMIGDTNGDMMMAKAAGVKATIAYLSDRSLKPENYPDADECIYNYNDLQFCPSKD